MRSVTEISSSGPGEWKQTVSLIIGNGTTIGTAVISEQASMSLNSLGDALGNAGRHSAAHVCYLMTGQSKMSRGQPVLVGGEIELSEILEFVILLSSPAKGAEAFTGLAYLQPYRLSHAMALSDLDRCADASK